MNHILKRRFQELAEQADLLQASKRVEYSSYRDRSEEVIDHNELLEWKVKAKNLLSKACGDESIHYRHFEDSEFSAYSSALDNLLRMKAVFNAARDDFEGGYLITMRGLIQAEVFDSELEQAAEFLKLGYKVPAAVIAGTVLETAIRNLCSKHKIAHAKLDKMNADLFKASVYNGIVQKRITYLAAIRNSAAHGKEAEFQSDDVVAMISEIEQFLANHKD